MRSLFFGEMEPPNTHTKHTFTLVGLRVELALIRLCECENGDFTYFWEIGPHYVLLLELNHELYEMKIWTDMSECYSGRYEAVIGYLRFRRVKHFHGKTHLPVDRAATVDITFSRPVGHLDEDEIWTEDEFVQDESENDDGYFSFSTDGGDKYYPSGDVEISMEKFTVDHNPRLMDKRPVWIIYGNSALGKSYIASYLQDLEVFETESVNELPEITAAVIVLGNRSNFTLEDVMANVPFREQTRFIKVHFEDI